MASTATATVTREQVTGLESEIADLKRKLATEETDLAALKGERTELAEKIALGEAPASKAPALERKIEEVETRIAGFNSVIARKQSQIDSAYPELRRSEAAATLATRKAALASLQQEGVEEVGRINSMLAELITERLVKLDSLRDEMMKYRDIGGQEAGADLCRALIESNGTLVEEHKLTDSTKWRSGDPIWRVRGDVVLTVRNLWPAKR